MKIRINTSDGAIIVLGFCLDYDNDYHESIMCSFSEVRRSPRPHIWYLKLLNGFDIGAHTDEIYISPYRCAL